MKSKEDKLSGEIQGKDQKQNCNFWKWLVFILKQMGRDNNNMPDCMDVWNAAELSHVLLKPVWEGALDLQFFDIYLIFIYIMLIYIIYIIKKQKEKKMKKWTKRIT